MYSSFIQQGKRLEQGAGLVEYTPITLLGLCILVSLFQIIVEQNHIFILVLGAVVLLVLCLIGYGVALDRKRKKDAENKL